jgi:streptogramin lyase
MISKKHICGIKTTIRNLVLLALFSSFLFFGALRKLYSENYYIQILESDKGFPKANYNSIYQDKYGFLWLCTQTGLLRYSGSNIKKFVPEASPDNGIKTEFFYQLVEDAEHNLWIATRKGLSWLDPSRQNIQTFLHDKDNSLTIPNNRIFNIEILNDSILLLACDRSGITSFNKHTHQVARISPEFINMPQKPENFWIRQYFIHSDSLVFLRTSTEYFRYNPVLNIVAPIVDELLRANNIKLVLNLFCDEHNQFWFQDQKNNLYKWEPGISLTPIHNDLLDEVRSAGGFGFFNFDSTRVLINNPSQNFLLHTTEHSLTKLDFSFELDADLNKTSITAICRTTDNNVFIAFRNGMLGQINPFQQEFKYKALVDPNTSRPLNFAFVLDDTAYKKRFISSFYHQSILVEDLISGEVSEIKKASQVGISSNRMIPDSQGRLWICQDNGIMEINRATLETTFHKPDEPAITLFEMAEIRPGVMMVGSFREGLFRFEPDAGIFKKVPETRGWISTQVFSMQYDPVHDVLWVGTVRNGLFRYDVNSDSFTQFLPESGNPQSIGGDWVRSIAIDSAGFVWMAADPAGLSRFDYNAPEGRQFRSFSIKDGLPSNHVAGLGVSNNGDIWLTTLNGVASMDPHNFSIKSWEIKNGEYNYGFHYANLSINQNNQVLIGTFYGYLQFDPQKLRQNQNPPSVYVTGFSVLDQNPVGRRFQPESPITLKHNENYFNIDFALVNFVDPQLSTVYYSLDNGQPEWLEIRESSRINFSKIAPGKYFFRLKAQNGDGIWSENQVNFPLVIKPPFWNTWWFYGLILMMIASMIMIAFRYRLNQLLTQNRLKAEKQMIQAEMEREVATLQMTALRAQMNPHFIFNCLNSINRFIVINDNETASEYLTKFSRLIRLVLDNSRSETISLKKEIETVGLYVEMEKLRFLEKFDYHIEIDPDISPENIGIQPMFIQPYAENAIWHGLMHKQNKGNLLIKIKKQMPHLVVTIQDNGIGRTKAHEIKSKQMTYNRSHGMKVTAERLSILNKKLKADAKITVTDLFDYSKNPSGTLVELWLPYDNLM